MYSIIILYLFVFSVNSLLNYDNISEINSRVWSKSHLTWTFINYPTHLNVSHKNAIYYEFLGAFRSWETISHFEFEFIQNNTGADIVINFMPPKHKLFEDDIHFSKGTLAHAFFPESGAIHMNDNVNWSLSFYPQPNTVNMFYVALHEIGHSLGLNHIIDLNSIMFPAYINIAFNYDAFNFTFESNSADEKLIK